MFEELRSKFKEYSDAVIVFFTKSIYGKLTSILVVIAVLQAFNIWTTLLSWIVVLFLNVKSSLLQLNYGVPIYYWLVIFLVFVWLVYNSIRQSILLSFVSGVFRDDFRRGLEKWEFGGEGWKNEKEDGHTVLSVSESPDGGITKKGFTWSDYDFSFQSKVITKNVGWIIRAENRNKYLMIQLNFEDSKPRLRLHLRVPESKDGIQWIVIDERRVDAENLTLLKWIKVKIIVSGSNVDVYLNNNHSAHYFIADPIRWKSSYSISGDSDKPKVDTPIASINYSAGKVGFRCSGHEHAHIKEVVVRPIL